MEKKLDEFFILIKKIFGSRFHICKKEKNEKKSKLFLHVKVRNFTEKKSFYFASVLVFIILLLFHFYYNFSIRMFLLFSSLVTYERKELWHFIFLHTYCEVVVFFNCSIIVHIIIILLLTFLCCVIMTIIIISFI